MRASEETVLQNVYNANAGHVLPFKFFLLCRSSVVTVVSLVLISVFSLSAKCEH